MDGQYTANEHSRQLTHTANGHSQRTHPIHSQRTETTNTANEQSMNSPNRKMGVEVSGKARSVVAVKASAATHSTLRIRIQYDIKRTCKADSAQIPRQFSPHLLHTYCTINSKRHREQYYIKIPAKNCPQLSTEKTEETNKKHHKNIPRILSPNNTMLGGTWWPQQAKQEGD